MNSEKTKNPDLQLVSIVLITFNSAEYITETLDSAKNQTYKNIELIIADDCSTDSTICICEKWLEVNAKYFVNNKIIRSLKNGGIAANCNLGIEAASGSWLKLCAGDDILLDNCIEKNIDFSKLNSDASIFISNMNVFIDKDNQRKIIETRKPKNSIIWSNNVSINEQYQSALKEYFGNTPTFFINSIVFKKLKFDENFPFVEDYGFALNALKSDFKILYKNEITVLYRQHSNSISFANSKVLYNSFYLKTREFDMVYRDPFLTKRIKMRENYEFNRKKMLIKLNLNHNNLFCRIINSASIRLNPYLYF